MTSRSSIRRHRTSSRHNGAPRGLGLLVTTLLLAAILMTGPAVLGSARLWIDFPLICGVAVLLLVQGLRLALTRPAVDGRRIDAIDWAVLIFVVYTVVRWLTSPTEYFSRVEMLDVTGYGGIFLTCRYGMANRNLAVLLLYLLVVLGACEAAFGFWLSRNLDFFLFGPTETLQLHYAPRWLGTYGCPNHYGSLLVMATGAVLAIGCFSRLAWPVRIVCFYVAILLLAGVIGSASRGAWIALIVSMAALVFWGIRHGTLRWWIPVTGAALMAIAAVILFTQSAVAKERSGELIDLVNGGNISTYVRVELARDALHIAHDYPLFGTGPATFEYVHPRYQDNTFAYKAELAHDDYLNCLDDYGLVGFGIAMFFVAAVTLKFFRPLEVDSRWQDRVIVVTGFAAWSALLIHSFVDFNLHIPANARMLFALTGLALGRIRPETGPHWSTVSLARSGRWLGGGVIVLSLAYLKLAAKSAWSDIIYESAFANWETVPFSESTDAAERAVAIDGDNPRALTFLGDLYRYRASRQKEMQGRLDEGQKAIDAYQRASAANPLDDAIQARMGMTYDVMRRYPEAFFCYSHALANQPYDGQFWYRLGNHYWQRGMFVQAEEAFLRSAACPHGQDGSREAEAQLRQLPEMEGIPLPPPGTNPLTAPADDISREVLP